MAPIQNKSTSSYSVHKSTSSHDSTSPRRGRDFTTDDAWEASFLPVTRRGRFFQDSFFENTRSHFDDAVREALSRWDDDSDFFGDSWHDAGSTRNSNLNRYRQMRSRKVDDDNLAVTVTSDNNIHKIVLDVHDFVDGDLKVKVVGERDLLVEGRKEKTQQDGASALSAQTFKRRFALPQETDMSAIDSVMSSDGILTITAPKVGRVGNAGSQSESRTFSSSTSSSKKQQEEREPCSCEKCNPRLCTRENASESRSERSQSRFSESSETKDSGKRSGSYAQEERKSVAGDTTSHHKMADMMDVPIKAFFNSRPITRRGRFFDDAFFEDTRSDYRTAIQDILSRWGERSSTMDDMTSYRNLRTRDMRDDNQAVRTIEDEFQHKFIVDVQDFMKDGEINVKAVDDRELVVEGLAEKHEGGCKSIKRFSRRFLLPEDVHLESVSSVMSSDGVLTIIAPKKNAISHMKETQTQVNTQKVENNSDVYESKMSNCNIQSSNSQRYENLSKELSDNTATYEMSKSSAQSSESQNYENNLNKTQCSDEGVYDERNLRASSTCSTGYENTTQGEESTTQSSVTASALNVEQSEKASVEAGRNITILVDQAEDEAQEEEAIENELQSNREQMHSVINSELEEAKQKIEEIGSGVKEAKEKMLEELLTDQRSVRAKSRESTLGMEERSSRGNSVDALEAERRSIREQSTDSRGMASGCIRFENEFEEADEDDVNFQGSSKHNEKKLRSILKTPERYLQDEDERLGRQSRERSYAGEESVDGDRRTPCRDTRKKAQYTPLNPDAKRVIPINVRGHFCSDAYFDDFHENFKTAISDVLLKYNEKSSSTDDITAYRNLRLRDPKLENQAYHIQEDQGAHRVVLDVKDFIHGEIEAAIYEEKELVIEGRAERRTGTSITTLSFLRRFPLPENVDTDAITVVMSSDGVLTVVTPWKGFSGLSAIKNILSTEDIPTFDRPSDFDRRWDEADWESSKASEEFLNRSIDSRLRSRLRHATDDLF